MTGFVEDEYMYQGLTVDGYELSFKRYKQKHGIISRLHFVNGWLQKKLLKNEKRTLGLKMQGWMYSCIYILDSILSTKIYQSSHFMESHGTSMY